MGPLKTAVKYSLVPLRIAVRIGDNFVAEEVDEEVIEEPVEEPMPRSAPGTAAAKRSRRKPAGPQASRAPKDLNDAALVSKVESIIFRDDSVPKGKIDVNAVDGVVWLRGEAENPEMINALEAATLEIPEVTQVENLLHLPKTVSYSRTDTPVRQRKTRSTTKKPTPRKVQTGVTNERRTTKGEPLPHELAREGEGRQPAPLGSDGGSDSES